MRFRRVAGAVVCGLGAVTCLVTAAVAGDGVIVFDPPDEGGVVPGATVSTKVYVSTPRTQEQIDGFVEQMKVANRQICDATDDLFRIGDVEFVSNPLEKDRADVWWLAGSGLAHATPGAFGRGAFKAEDELMGTALQDALNDCFLARQQGMDCEPTVLASQCDAPGVPVEIGNFLGVVTLFDGDTGHTIAHEFGHALFGIRDLYPDPVAGRVKDFGLRYYNGAGECG